MSNQFYQKNKKNLLDNLIIDVKELYDKFPINRKINPKPNLIEFNQSFFHKIYRNRFIPLKYRNYFWHFFRRLKLDLSWFKLFNAYWIKLLGGRSLYGVEDFYFFNNFYRVKFQDNQIPDTNDPYEHLEAWQRPELIYQLFHLTYREAISNKLHLLSRLRKNNKKFRSILEFGCGTAPIITTLFDFFRLNKDIKIYISDIQTIAFHYAAYKFRSCSNVISLLLIPENNFLLNEKEKVDLIFCLAVFEHLNKPSITIEKFHKILNRDGFLIFNFIKTEGEGLDTHHAARERNDVLEFIKNNFEVVYGKIKEDQDLGLTIVKKK